MKSLSPFLGTLLFIISFTGTLFGFNRGHELVNIPSALMENKGFMESGFTFSSGYRNVEGFDTYLNLYLRAGLTPWMEYSLTEEKNSLYHHAQIQVAQFKLGRAHHFLSIGVKNVGFNLPTSPNRASAALLLGGYAVYSIQTYENGPIAHLGVGQNKFNDNLSTFGGFEFPILNGSVFSEYDGNLFSFGFQFISDQRIRFSAAIEYAYNEDKSRSPETFKLGLSILDLGNLPELPPTLCEKIASKNERLRYPNREFSNINVSIAIKNIMPSQNNGPESLSQSKFKIPTVNTQKFKESIPHLQSGMTYFYAGDYQHALIEYQKFARLLPNLAIGHASLGTIYMQMGYKEAAMEEWKKALAIDPETVVPIEPKNKKRRKK